MGIKGSIDYDDPTVILDAIIKSQRNEIAKLNANNKKVLRFLEIIKKGINANDFVRLEGLYKELELLIKQGI